MFTEPTTVMGHPTQRQLVAFAESLVDNRRAVSALLAAHVSECSACAREVKKIRASFEVAALAQLPEPSGDLTHRILVRAQEAQVKHVEKSTAAVVCTRLLQGVTCIAASVALAFVAYSAALRSVAPEMTPVPAYAAADTGAHAASDTNDMKRDNVQAFATAVSSQQERVVSPYEYGHWRALESLNRDLDAARAALERNPGCLRANQVMRQSMAQQLEGLRDLYLDRKL